MTFTAADNNIQIKDSSGNVTFDTGTPMPHIVSTLTGTKAHTFPDTGQTVHMVSAGSMDTMACPQLENVCVLTNVCGYENVCDWVWVDTSGFVPVCGWEYGNTGYPDYIPTQVWVCQDVWVPSQQLQWVCAVMWVCNWVDVCNPEWVPGPQYATTSMTKNPSLESETTYTLGTLPTGTNPDFLIVQFTATRSSAGNHKDYGTFAATIPTGQKIAANGTTMLEGVFNRDGSQWLARTVSCQISGDAIEMRFQHSSAQHDSESQTTVFACNSYPSASAPIDTTSSAWSLDYIVYVGKFTT